MPEPFLISIVVDDDDDDDDESVRLALEGLVRSAGYVARMFASAEGFLASSALGGTSCLVTDIKMSRMSGVDLHRHLVGHGHNVPVIFITTFSTEAIRRRPTGPGVIAFLRKPFDGDLMLDKIAEAVGAP
jgi:FixJ family two-component response regulator